MEAISTGTFNTDTFVKGKGAWLYNEKGEAFFDATAGSGAASLGHQHDKVIQAVTSQVNKLIHTGCKLGADIRAKLASKILKFSHYNDGATLFTVTGSEAVEASFKIARAYTGRKSIAHFEYAFHGKTTGPLSATWRKSFKQYSNLNNDGFVNLGVPPTDDLENENNEYFNSISKRIEDLASEGNCPAAIILEPIRVTEGVLPISNIFLENLIRLMNSHKILVIFDEIYVGLGRCGQVFYSDHLSLKPDITLVGKTLGNGFPISLVIGEKETINALPSGVQTSTYSGNPVCSAAAISVLEVLEEESLWKVAQGLEKNIHPFLVRMANEYAFISNIRALGALFAFTCVDANGEIAPDIAIQIKNKAQENNMLLFAGGYNGGIVKLVPPIIMSEKEINDFKAILEQTFKDVAKKLG